MRAVVYRPIHLHGSWRPRSLVDLRGPRFPEEYQKFQILAADSIDTACDQYPATTGDVIFLGTGKNRIAYVVAPFGWELVKFGQEWRSP